MPAPPVDRENLTTGPSSRLRVSAGIAPLSSAMAVLFRILPGALERARRRGLTTRWGHSPALPEAAAAMQGDRERCAVRGGEPGCRVLNRFRDFACFSRGITGCGRLFAGCYRAATVRVMPHTF